jgi:hypothetical protein
MKTEATIRQWVSAKYWGIANERITAGVTPRRFFVHGSKALTPEVAEQLGVGVRILFVEGAPRQSGELAAALEIELAPVFSPVRPIEEANSLGGGK